MKRGLLLLCLPLMIIGAAPRAEAKRPTFRVDSLQVDLPSKFNNAGNRNRVSTSIRTRLLEMRRCFVAVVKENPQYDGFLWLAVTFDKQGKVRQKTITTTVENGVAMKCMEWMVDFWKLPRGVVGKANAQVRIYAK
jgi:hypothetical protein